MPATTEPHTSGYSTANRPAAGSANGAPAGARAAVAGVRAHQYGEGSLAKAIETQTAKIPSDVFLWASGASMAASLTAKAMGSKHTALFIGQWAAPFLILGLYNKLVKLEGSE